MARDCPPCPPCNPTLKPDAAPRPRATVKVPASAKPFQPAALSVPSKGPAAQTESIQYGEIAAVPSYPIRGCCTKPTGGKTCNAPPRAGQVELVFPSRKDAAAHGVPFGPALQFCSGFHEGQIVPMKNPEAAKRIATAYTDCIAKGSPVEACVVETKGLSGLRARAKQPAGRRKFRRASRMVRKLGRRR